MEKKALIQTDRFEVTTSIEKQKCFSFKNPHLRHWFQEKYIYNFSINIFSFSSFYLKSVIPFTHIIVSPVTIHNATLIHHVNISISSCISSLNPLWKRFNRAECFRLLHESHITIFIANQQRSASQKTTNKDDFYGLLSGKQNL